MKYLIAIIGGMILAAVLYSILGKSDCRLAAEKICEDDADPEHCVAEIILTRCGNRWQ